MIITKRLLTSLYGFSLAVGALLSTCVLASQDAAPFTTAYRYDLGGQLTGKILPDPDGPGLRGFPATRHTYNAYRLVERIETGELSQWQDDTVAPSAWSGFSVTGITVFRYDSQGRQTIQAQLDGQGLTQTLTQVNYDVYQRVRCRAVRLSAEGLSPASYSSLPDACEPAESSTHGKDRITRYTYNSFDQVLIEERAVGTPLSQAYVTNTYTTQGLLKTQTDANGNVTELDYNNRYQLYRRYYPSATTTGVVNKSNGFNEYRYDDNGNLNYEIKRNGKVIQYAHDKLNRMVKKDLLDNTHSPDVYYTYDLRGLSLSARFGSQSGQGIINTFDGFGHLKTSTTNLGDVTRTLSYQHDAHGNRTRITHPDDVYFTYGFDGIDRVDSLTENSSATLLSLAYGNQGRRQTISRPGGAVTTYAFDDVSRLDSFQQNFAGSTSDLTNSFTYNPASQVTQITLSNPVYRYQGNENRTGTYVPNGLNQYTHIAGQPLSYDTKGNLTNDGSLIYTYDDENRLVSTSGGATSSFQFDPLGRLHEATINGTTTRFLYDGDALVAEYNSAGTLTRRYVHGDQVDEPWVQYNSASVGSSHRRYLHADHQGSIMAHSNSAGTVLNTLSYDSYGIPKSTNVDRFGYTGQIWFKELGLFHYKARFYHPKFGRFLQTDPIFYEDQMNLYAYVGNDPVNAVDPTGMATSLAVNAFRIGVRTRKYGNIGGAVRGVGKDISYDWNQLGNDSTATIGQKLGSTSDLILGTAFNESAEDSEGSGKSRNKPPEPLEEAEGNPHSIIEKPGKEGQYTTHNGDGTKKQYRGAGKDHGPVPRPNVKEYGKNTTPEGKTFPDKGRVRPPRPEEIP